MTEFGKSKILDKKQLENLGYNLIIYPVTTQRLAMKNVEMGLKSIFENGHQNKYRQDAEKKVVRISRI